jgi:hypothetical protein
MKCNLCQKESESQNMDDIIKADWTIWMHLKGTNMYCKKCSDIIQSLISFLDEQNMTERNADGTILSQTSQNAKSRTSR